MVIGGRSCQLVCCVLVLCCFTATTWLTSRTPEHELPLVSARNLQDQDQEHQDTTSLKDVKTLRFEVCNGFTNQRLSVVYGVLLAKLLDRAVVLPDLISNGRQSTDFDVQADATNRLRFSDAYDANYFRLRMKELGITVIPAEEAPALALYTVFQKLPRPVVEHVQEFASVQHVQVGCALFKLWKWEVALQSLPELMWKVLESLKPSATVATAVEAGVSALTPRTDSHGFNFLHMRVEQDWIAHCQRWQSIQDGIKRDNCFGSVGEIGNFLLSRGVDPKLPLYVATYWEDAPQPQVSTILASLVAAGFGDVRKRQDIFKDQPALPREAAAAVDYHLALQAEKFVGNSVATFSALLMLQRWHEGRWAAHYNGGSIPLADMLPVDDLVTRGLQTLSVA